MTREFLLHILFVGLVMSIGSIYLFFSYMDQGIDKARTVAFAALVMFQFFIGLSSRSKLPMKRIGFLTNKRLLMAIASSMVLLLLIIYLPVFNSLFKTVPLFNIVDWIKIILISSTVFVILELVKINKYRNK